MVATDEAFVNRLDAIAKKFRSTIAFEDVGPPPLISSSYLRSWLLEQAWEAVGNGEPHPMKVAAALQASGISEAVVAATILGVGLGRVGAILEKDVAKYLRGDVTPSMAQSTYLWSLLGSYAQKLGLPKDCVQALHLQMEMRLSYMEAPNHAQPAVERMIVRNGLHWAAFLYVAQLKSRGVPVEGLQFAEPIDKRLQKYLKSNDSEQQVAKAPRVPSLKEETKTAANMKSNDNEQQVAKAPRVPSLKEETKTAAQSHEDPVEDMKCVKTVDSVDENETHDQEQDFRASVQILRLEREVASLRRKLHVAETNGEASLVERDLMNRVFIQNMSAGHRASLKRLTTSQTRGVEATRDGIERRISAMEEEMSQLILELDTPGRDPTRLGETLKSRLQRHVQQREQLFGSLTASYHRLVDDMTAAELEAETAASSEVDFQRIESLLRSVRSRSVNNEISSLLDAVKSDARQQRGGLSFIEAKLFSILTGTLATLTATEADLDDERETSHFYKNQPSQVDTICRLQDDANRSQAAERRAMAEARRATQTARLLKETIGRRGVDRLLGPKIPSEAEGGELIQLELSVKAIASFCEVDDGAAACEAELIASVGMIRDRLTSCTDLMPNSEEVLQSALSSNIESESFALGTVSFNSGMKAFPVSPRSNTSDDGDFKSILIYVNTLEKNLKTVFDIVNRNDHRIKFIAECFSPVIKLCVSLTSFCAERQREFTTAMVKEREDRRREVFHKIRGSVKDQHKLSAAFEEAEAEKVNQHQNLEKLYIERNEMVVAFAAKEDELQRGQTRLGERIELMKAQHSEREIRWRDALARLLEAVEGQMDLEPVLLGRLDALSEAQTPVEDVDINTEEETVTQRVLHRLQADCESLRSVIDELKDRVTQQRTALVEMESDRDQMGRLIEEGKEETQQVVAQMEWRWNTIEREIINSVSPFDATHNEPKCCWPSLN